MHVKPGRDIFDRPVHGQGGGGHGGQDQGEGGQEGEGQSGGNGRGGGGVGVRGKESSSSTNPHLGCAWWCPWGCCRRGGGQGRGSHVQGCLKTHLQSLSLGLLLDDPVHLLPGGPSLLSSPLLQGVQHHLGHLSSRASPLTLPLSPWQSWSHHRHPPRHHHRVPHTAPCPGLLCQEEQESLQLNTPPLPLPLQHLESQLDLDDEQREREGEELPAPSHHRP